MRLRPRTTTLLVSLGTAAALSLQVAPAAALPGRSGPAIRRHRPCTSADTVPVPGAERGRHGVPRGHHHRRTAHGGARRQYTDQADWVSLHAPGTVNPTGVPGLQVDGYFPDTSSFNTTHGWNHDSQFVLRIPDDWNGGLVVTGAPGNRKQYAPDFLISDFVLAQGFAYASTDKGNNSPDFYLDGAQPGDAVAEWHERVTQLAVAAKDALRERYGHKPDRTYMAGISNGGYLVRWQLENRPELYDGGVDWEGTLFTPDGPNLFTYLPTAVRYTLGQATTEDMYDAGFAPGSEALWPYHQTVYWGLTQKVYRAEFDPAYDPACPGATARHDGARAPRAVPERRGLRRVVRRPGVTAGARRPGADQPDRQDQEAAADAARDAGHPAPDQHRQRRLRGDDRRPAPRPAAPLLPDRGRQPRGQPDGRWTRSELRPMLPCFRTAFDALTAWVEDRRSRRRARPCRVRPGTGPPTRRCSTPARWRAERRLPETTKRPRS